MMIQVQLYITFVHIKLNIKFSSKNKIKFVSKF